MERAELVFLDLEMTGTDPGLDRICEVAVTRTRGKEVVGRLSALVHPGRSVGPSEAVHGISDAQLEGAPPLHQLRDELRELLTGAVLVGHAVGFDVAFLAAAAERGEVDPPPSFFLDTRQLAKRAWHRSSYGLASLCEARALLRPTHRAEADVQATRALFDVLVEELRAKTPKQLWQAQPRGAKDRGFREDVLATFIQAVDEGRAVRFAYRTPGRSAFEDVIEPSRFDPPHVSGHLRTRDLNKTLRGDRVLWACLADAPPSSQ